MSFYPHDPLGMADPAVGPVRLYCVDPDCPDYGTPADASEPCPTSPVCPPLPAVTRCTDPDCPDYGKAVDPGHPRADGMPTGDEDTDDDPFGYYADEDSQPDDPWAGRPVARGTFRQRWLLGPKFIYRRRLPRSDYYDVVLMVDLRSWMFGFESWPGRGGALQVGPIQINVSEPPF